MGGIRLPERANGSSTFRNKVFEGEIDHPRLMSRDFGLILLI